MKHLFISLTQLIFLTLLFPEQLMSQSAQNFWKDQKHSSRSGKGFNTIKSRELSLAFNDYCRFLNKELNRNKSISIDLPMPNGTTESFIIRPVGVMSPQLAAKYPMIKTYVGQGINNRHSYLRLDYTPHGIHAMVLNPKGSVFIDPPYPGDTEHYISYYKRDLIKTDDFEMHCTILDDIKMQKENDPGNALSAGTELRTYRLALAATAEYTAKKGGTVTGALAGMVTTMNRVNGVYETELGIRMILIDNTDTLIYLNAATDPYSNNDGGTMLDENQTNVDNLIGNANYDIGHVFSTGGGGIAGLGVVCTANSKANGVTGSSSPVNDAFDIDYVAHEMGHQFGANHTFNATSGSCFGNGNLFTAYEPGSGTTIMAYAGICGSSDNAQTHSDPYFHIASLREIISYSTTGGGNACPVITSTGNNPPGVTTPTTTFNIPFKTPFILTGSASDPDGDSLTYSWEEYDRGVFGSVTATPVGNSPIFRVWSPSTDNYRIFPKLSTLIANSSSNFEKLPTYARTMNFKMVVRDNKQNGGAIAYNTTNVKVNVINTDSAFMITSPNTFVYWAAGTQKTVKWDVVKTNLSPINCQFVNILLSYDGGYTYPDTLAANTPNDGSEVITVPDSITTNARVKIEAVGNIFFDISNVNFKIYQDETLGMIIQPFIDTLKLWNVYSCKGNLVDTCVTITYRFGSDTTINSLKYYTLESSYDSIPGSWAYAGTFREDTAAKKVYRWINQQDELLYDFSLNPGDVFSYGCSTMKVDSVKSVTYYGVIRKQWYFNKSGWNQPETWVSGIGNQFGPFENLVFTCMTDYKPKLICYKEDGALRYFDNAFSDCYQTNVSTKELYSNSKEIIILPNPSSDKFGLNFPDPSEKLITVTNSLGQVVQKFDCTSKYTEIDVKTKGIYFISVFQNNQLWTGKIVKN